MSLFLMAREPSVYRRVVAMLARTQRPYSVHCHTGSWESAQTLLAAGNFQVVLVEFERLNTELSGLLLVTRRRVGFSWLCLDTAYNVNRDCLSANLGACDYLALDRLNPSRLERSLYYASKLGDHVKELSEMAYKDGLSQLPNRLAFSEHLQALIDQRVNVPKSDPQSFALLFIDLDRFKVINDTLGHKVGNEVIKIVSERIRRAMQSYDYRGFSARYAGDEFVLLLEQFLDKSSVVKWTKSLVDSISRTIHWHSHAFEVGCSIGIAYFPEDATSIERLIDCADTAMYTAKKNSRSAELSSSALEQTSKATHWVTNPCLSARSPVREYCISMDFDRRQDRAMENALRQALKRKEFCLLYQPRFKANASADLVSVEALLRWRHPERGLLSPSEFLSVAEKNDLIVAIGRWVVSQSLEDWTQMRLVEGLEHLNLALNFSLNQLLDTELIQDFQHAMREVDVPDMQGVELEVRETAGLSHIDRVEKHLRFLAQMGVRISLDDFGSGQASLMHLQRLPIHAIKFNNPKVKQMRSVDAESNVKIIKALIGLARGLDKQATVEGIETESQHREIISCGCDFLQGFYYCEPLPLADCVRWMTRYQNNRVEGQQSSIDWLSLPKEETLTSSAP